MSARGWLLAAELALVSLVAGCGDGPVEGPPPGFATCPAGADAGSASGVPDYWHDAKPILDRRCATCHMADGIAPFPLLTYEDAHASALLVEGAVATRTMPPWPPNDCCRTYAHDRSLSVDDRALLLRWLDAGAPEGDPQGAPPSTPPAPPALARVDVTLRLSEPYVPVAQEETGEWRCFLLEDWPFTEEKLVTGVNVQPGNRAIVHDVIVQTVAESDLPEVRALDGVDGRPGLDCRDLRDALLVNGRLGSWAPGVLPFESSDAKLGIPVPARSKLMLQIHYDVRNGVTAPDQTELELELADTVLHRARSLVVAGPTYDPKMALVLHGIGLHMPGGSRGRVAIRRADGSWDCLLDVPAWNDLWAGTYQLAEPVQVRPGDRLIVECHWDDAAAADELCTGLMLATETWP